MIRTTLLALSLAVGVLVGGCGAINNAVDCQAICNRYQSCFNSSYDTGACASRCRTDSANDPDYQHKATVCSACIDQQSCTSATFSCSGSCGTIVP